jgi:hypothetical protein
LGAEEELAEVLWVVEEAAEAVGDAGPVPRVEVERRVGEVDAAERAPFRFDRLVWLCFVLVGLGWICGGGEVGRFDSKGRIRLRWLYLLDAHEDASMRLGCLRYLSELELKAVALHELEAAEAVLDRPVLGRHQVGAGCVAGFGLQKCVCGGGGGSSHVRGIYE